MQGHLAEETLMTIASSHRWHFFCFVDKKKKQWILAVAVVESSKSNKVDVFNFSTTAQFDKKHNEKCVEVGRNTSRAKV